MNTGIQDAANLAWKLHHVLSLGAPESLLDSYDAERRPNAQQLIEFTHQIATLATLTGPKERQMRDDILAAISQVPGDRGLVCSFLPNRDRLRRQQRTLRAGDAGQSRRHQRRRPRVVAAHTRGSAAGSAPGFKVTVSKDVSHPVSVRPDGIVASAEQVHELFGLNLAADVRP
jgi:FAD binding domain